MSGRVRGPWRMAHTDPNVLMCKTTDTAPTELDEYWGPPLTHGWARHGLHDHTRFAGLNRSTGKSCWRWRN